MSDCPCTSCSCKWRIPTVTQKPLYIDTILTVPRRGTVISHIKLEGLSVIPPCVRIFSLKLWEELPLVICIFRTVLPLLYFNPVHHRIPLISICNAMVLISKRVGFAKNTHEPWSELVQKIVHRLIDATEPGGSVVLQIVFIEVVYHLPHIMKPTQKWRRRLGCKPRGGGNWYEPVEVNVLLHPEGVYFLNWYQFWGPSQSPVRDSLKSWH